ncbi:MAG: hypothetical protein FWF90_03720 [Promicromonosporaceae bacterium]|nr:hypothetical protein [Promicromonosporaceae bacterium]
MSGFMMLGDGAAAACEGDACLLPGAVAAADPGAAEEATRVDEPEPADAPTVGR